MPDINILIPIDQQFLTIPNPFAWAEIKIPGDLTRSLKNSGHTFTFSFAVISGAPILITGDGKILGGGNEFPIPVPVGEYLNNDEWVNTSGSFTTPTDWTTKSILIYWRVMNHYPGPCTISWRDFKMMVSIPSKPQYLPIMGVG